MTTTTTTTHFVQDSGWRAIPWRPPVAPFFPLCINCWHSLKCPQNDVLYDLGCGDGRICLEGAARHAVGVEVEADLIQRFRQWIAALPADRSVQAVHADLRHVLSSLVKRAKGEVDVSEFRELPLPTIIVMYLLPEAIQELEGDLLLLLAMLEPLKIICNTWGLTSVQPANVLEVEEGSGGGTTTLFLYNRESLR